MTQKVKILAKNIKLFLSLKIINYTERRAFSAFFFRLFFFGFALCQKGTQTNLLSTPSSAQSELVLLLLSSNSFCRIFSANMFLFSIFHLFVLFALCACILLTFNNLHLSLSTLHWGLRLQLTIWGKIIQLLYHLQAVKTILKKRYIESKKCFVTKFHLWVQC